MPRIKIRGEKEGPAIELFLESIGGAVILRCIGLDGEDWSILAINGSGECVLQEFLPKESGLQVNKNGRMRIERE